MKYAYCLDCENVYQDDGKTPRRCPSCGGARVVVRSNNELVSGVISWPVDDAAREQVIHDLRSAVNDYTLLTGLAGDLSGAQLD